MDDCSSLEHCVFYAICVSCLSLVALHHIKRGICVTTDLEELNLYGDDGDGYDLQSRKNEYHWTIFELILRLIRYSGTDLTLITVIFHTKLQYFCVCLNRQEMEGKAGHACK